MSRSITNYGESRILLFKNYSCTSWHDNLCSRIKLLSFQTLFDEI